MLDQKNTFCSYPLLLPQASAKGPVINPIWNANFAYCMGIMASDGNLSPDGRHIKIISKDEIIILNCQKALNPGAKITKQSRCNESEKKYFVLQFSDVKLYRFMNSIGLTSAKSKTIESVQIPYVYFRDFLRGEFDGDGSISIFKNKVSKQPQVKMRFASASYIFLIWLKTMIFHHASTAGGFITRIPGSLGGDCFSLDFGKSDAGKIINFMYYDGVQMFLDRKRIICGRVEK